MEGFRGKTGGVMRVQCGWRKDCRGLERTGERLEGCGGG